MSEKPVILVVDDDAPILILMQNLLREFGFEPLTAASGNEAIDIARGRRPALVLLDRNMPGMSGEEVIRARTEERRLGERRLTGDVDLTGVQTCALPISRSPSSSSSTTTPRS